MLRAALALTLVSFAGPSLAADDPVFSGPQAGEKLTALKVQGVYGPYAGKEVDLTSEHKGAVVYLFVHESTRPGHRVLRAIDHYGTKWAGDGLATHFIWLSGDKTKTEEFLKFGKASLNLDCPIGISLDGMEGPGNYGLNRKVTLTCLVAKGNKVVANHAIVQPNETDSPKILADVAKMLGKQAPTQDEIQKAIGAGRKPPEGKDPEGADEVKGMMRPLLKETDKDKIAETFRRMDGWAGRDRAKAAWLKSYLELVFEKSKYGTKEVQDAYVAWKKSKEEKK
ncbi:MAG: hypothetical protein K2R98_12430 [Gemmataceae bacterium]|nr:hypothetical protein [Gemmataceae bacterium]